MNTTTNQRQSDRTESSVRWLDIGDVCAVTKCKRTWVYTRMKDSTDPFPKGIRLSARCVRWDAAAVSAWMARRAPAAPVNLDLLEPSPGAARV